MSFFSFVSLFLFSIVDLFLLFFLLLTEMCYFFVIQCDKRFFWNEVMVKELLNSEVGFLSVHGK